MSEWKTIKEKTIEIGNSNFLEINLKQPPESEDLLIGISKGWFNDDGQKRYKTNILFNKDNKEQLIEALKSIED